MKNCFITNIPTPYRISMWNQLSQLLGNSQKKINVLFMNKKEPNRDWVIHEKIEFSHKIWNMHIFQFFGIYFRFSPSYVLSAVSGHEHIILGCSWNDLNVVSIAILKRLHIIKAKISFWTEANYLTIGARKEGKFKSTVRKFILNSADGWYFIPGQMSLITLDKWGVNCADRCVELPNLPHSSFDKNVNSWTGSGKNRPVITIVARLDEPIKGIKNYLIGLGVNRISGVDINIIGSGPDEELYKKFVSDNKLNDNVHFLGSLSVDGVIDFLTKTDILALPSFSDPSPLILVEACKIGLPLLVSNRCGNHYECVHEALNGYVFDPDDKISIQKSFDEMVNHRNDWRRFSQKSIEIAEEKFNTHQVLSRLISFL